MVKKFDNNLNKYRINLLDCVICSLNKATLKLIQKTLKNKRNSTSKSNEGKLSNVHE